MSITNCAYVTKNWFKQIFLQLYLDQRRSRVFAEAKKRTEWKCPDDLMTFEENCYVTNEEILSSFELILKEEMLYGVTSREQSEHVLNALKTALDENSRERYLKLLSATGEYPESTGVFYFSDDLKYLCWRPEKGNTFQAAFRAMITAIQNGKEWVKHPRNLADHFGFFLFLSLLPYQDHHLEIPYRSHPLPGIGRSHTHLSLTDPGRGQRQATVLRRESFETNYVHVEHLERLGRTRREIESYRVPNILDFVVLRACVGDLAPVTAYLGRPLCEHSGTFDLLKAANLASAAATAFFAMGAAEIKLAIDPLTITQAMAYLERLMTLRCHPRQALSVAFNLNREYVGVDGIGIGGAQVLRLIDRMGHEGPFLEENLDIINRERDEAEASVRGKAARLLCCLDRLYFEGSLLEELESVRQELFREMKSVNESALSRILQFASSFDLPIRLQKDPPESDYELWVCKRIVASGEKGVAYIHGCKQNKQKMGQALKDLQAHIAQADDIPAVERRVYYLDAIRQYKEEAGWPADAKPLRAKFFLFSQKGLPKEMAMERAS